VEERRDALRRTALRAALCLAATLVAVTTEACEPPGDFIPRAVLKTDGVAVVFRTIPATIELGRHFVVEALVCAPGPTPTLTRVDADMPEHRHGMNYRPTIAGGGGRYRAEGFLLHMSGRWRLSFDVEHAGGRTRLTSDLLLE
jgi:hypothetical protein